MKDTAVYALSAAAVVGAVLLANSQPTTRRARGGSINSRPAIVVPNAAPLYIGENGDVTCARHRPSSDFHTERLSDAEVAEWRVFIHDQYGAGTPLCEGCRRGHRFLDHRTARRASGGGYSQSVELTRRRFQTMQATKGRAAWGPDRSQELEADKAAFRRALRNMHNQQVMRHPIGTRPGVAPRRKYVDPLARAKGGHTNFRLIPAAKGASAGKWIVESNGLRRGMVYAQHLGGPYYGMTATGKVVADRPMVATRHAAGAAVMRGVL